MAFLFRDWLAASESLPLEGIGLLHWERRPAYVNESDSTVYPAQWELCLAVESDMKASDALFQRLASFSRLPVSEIKQQYHSWMDAIKSSQSSFDVFGFGRLSNEDQAGWSWSAASLPVNTSVSLAHMPIIPRGSNRPGWDLGIWMVLLVALLAAVYIGLIFKQKGCTPEVGSSRLKTELLPDHSAVLPYQEIR